MVLRSSHRTQKFLGTTAADYTEITLLCNSTVCFGFPLTRVSGSRSYRLQMIDEYLHEIKAIQSLRGLHFIHTVGHRLWPVRKADPGKMFTT